MKALILAAGYATRLYPLTKEYPKPLLEVKGKPIISHILAKLDKVKEIDEVFVVTNAKFFGKFRSWKKSLNSQKKITLVNDLTKSNVARLGAMGDINFVINKKKVKDDLLIIGGDNLFNRSLTKFFSFAKKNGPAVTVGLYRVKNKADASRYGVAKIDAHNRIKEFMEKPLHPQSNLVAMCLYYIPKDSLFLIRKYMAGAGKKNDATGSYFAWMLNKLQIHGFIFDGSWFDIGDYKFLNAAKKYY